MADSIYTFDPTAANNTSLDTIPYGPNQLYHNQIDNLFRAINAKTAQFVDDIGGVATTAGTANAQTVTLSSGFTAYAAGQIFRVKIGSGLTNTSANVTLNVNSIGAKTVKVHRGTGLVDPAVGDIVEGNYALFVYDGTYLVLLNPSQVVLESTDAGAAAGPLITLYRNSATPAASDVLGQILFHGEDSAGNPQEYGSIDAIVVDPTSGSEDSTLNLYAQIGGSRTRIVALGSGGITNISTGTYTPTLTNTTNIDSSTASICQWMRVGDMVTVSGRVIIDATTSSVSTVLGFSLPVAATFSSAVQLGGTAVATNSLDASYAILADTANNRATFQGVPATNSSRTLHFTFMYQIP